MEDEFTPKRLKDKYVLQEMLGRGGMGIVYKALLMPIEREVALKMFRPPTGMFSPDQVQELRSRFIMEGLVLAKMRHKNIMTLHDFDIDNDLPFYTMDLLPNSLAKMIQEDFSYPMTKPLPEEEVFQISLQICDGLSHLHSNGVIHRDLKPGNILLAEDNIVKVSDFGISDIEWLDFTMYGQGFMSVDYCAPEQRKGEPVTAVSDLYSIGVTLYKLLTGRFPSVSYTPVSEIVVGADPIWDEILLRALIEDPKERFQSASEFKLALLEFENQERVLHKNMVKIPAGEFRFGSEKEVRSLPDFWIDKFPVTNNDYRKFIESQNYPKPAFWDNPKFNRENQPVVGVSWLDAAAYAKWANKRLPTEEEWEKAARGTDGNLYPWGKNLPDAENCNYGESIGRTSDVNRYKTNKSVYGCCDLIGNVWEWTRDEKTDDASCEIIKGGSWLSFPLQLKCHNKDYLRTDEMKDYVGFRCVAND